MQNTAQLAGLRRRRNAGASPHEEPYRTNALNGDDGIWLFWLIWILMSTITRGIDGMSLAVYRNDTPPNTAGGGLSPAGKWIIILWATVLGTPLGIMAGIYLAEYGRKSGWRKSFVLLTTFLLFRAVGWVMGLFTPSWWRRCSTSPVGQELIALARCCRACDIRTTENILKLVPG